MFLKSIIECSKPDVTAILSEIEVENAWKGLAENLCTTKFFFFFGGKLDRSFVLIYNSTLPAKTMLVWISHVDLLSCSLCFSEKLMLLWRVVIALGVFNTKILLRVGCQFLNYTYVQLSNIMDVVPRLRTCIGYFWFGLVDQMKNYKHASRYFNAVFSWLVLEWSKEWNGFIV